MEKAKERKEALLLLIIRCGHVDVDHFSKGIRGGLGLDAIILFLFGGIVASSTGAGAGAGAGGPLFFFVCFVFNSPN